MRGAAVPAASPPWVAPVEQRDVVLDGGRVAELSSLLAATAISPGGALPPLWHWAALAQWPAPEELGPDGHRRHDPCLPPLPDGSRRMFAGGSVELLAPLTTGTPVRLRRQVVAVEDKQGRSGPLLLVTVELRLSDADGTPLLVERQQLAYRRQAPSGHRAATPPPAEHVDGPPLQPRPDGRWDLRTDPVLLMRFSAATANAHRIHYDAPYACGMEGYPGLVVQGPLLAVALAEVLRRTRPEATVRGFRFRASAPLLCGQPAEMGLVPDGDGTSLRATRADPGHEPVVLMTTQVDLD